MTKKINELGISVTKEPHAHLQSSDERTDFQVMVMSQIGNGNESIQADISSIYPLANSYLLKRMNEERKSKNLNQSRNIKTPKESTGLASINFIPSLFKEREEAKYKKYADLCRKDGSMFLPLPFLLNGGYSNKFKTLLDKLKQPFFNKDEKDWVKWKKEFVIDLTCARLQVIGDKVKKGLVLQGILREKVKLLDRGDQSIMSSREFEEVIG